jgi:uncharacterized protein (TIGR03437 family)
VKFHIFAFFAVIFLLSSSFTASAQVDSAIGQVTTSASESFAGGISGDGRFIVFESTGNVATENPRNSDGNREIFLFDYAQRRIFQITDTRALLTNAANAPSIDNIKVDIVSLRPVISNDGRWIAFGSNATCAYPGRAGASPLPAIVSATNPGSFNPNATTGNDCLVGTGTNQTNNLVNDGNTEMWLYQVPAVAPVADLSAGEEIALTDLAGGTFTRITNTLPSRLPLAGSTNNFPIVADDNHDSSIDDTGSAISFTSNRDLTPCPTAPTATCGNAAPSFDNDEIYSFVRSTSTLTQVSATTRGSIGNPIYNANSTITNLNEGGWRIVFLSNGNTPIPGMTGNNADNNEEVFLADIDGNGALGTRKKQVTTTARAAAGDVVNILNYGRRMSRDGNYIGFDSYADLENEHNGVNQVGFATFIYNVAADRFERLLPRSNADSGSPGIDFPRYPGFTDYNESRAPQTVVLETRMNIRASDGTIPATATEGLNNDPARPTQLYSTTPAFIQQPTPPARIARPYKRLTKLPVPSTFFALVQPIPSNDLERMTFNLTQTEIGTGNPDLLSEVYYFLLPDSQTVSTVSLSFATGASRIPVLASPTPTPTPTPTPSPTPQTPSAVLGVSPGMLAILDYNSGLNTPVVARTAVGSIDRRFPLPIELSGVTMSINGAAVGLKSVNPQQIVFVVPPGLSSSTAGTSYPVAVNNNGVIFRGNITIVPTQPDIFTDLLTPGPGGRARVFNATNRVLTREPFTIRTFRLRGSRLVPTVLRLYLTGVNGVPASLFTIRIGNRTISGASVITSAVQIEPGVYTVDFTLPPELAGAGDQPIVVSVTVNGVTFSSRLDDTAPRLFIL